jgi:glycosyltransferase involved in cell wall biosynthesis
VRIMFVVTRADVIGGVHVHVRDLAAALLQRGHEAVVVAGRRGRFTEALRRAGVPEVECPSLQREINPRDDARALRALRREVASFAPDLVSTHSSKAGILGRLACVGGPPCLFTAHGWAFTEGVPERRRRIYREIERRLAPLAARVICVSEHDRQIGIAAGIDPRRLVTIHNGMPDIPDELRADPGRGEPVRAVMVARFVPQKDHRTLLRAAAAVAGLHLDLVGDGPELAAMQDLAGSLGIADRVRFLGHRDDVADLLARAHLFTLISNWEGFPRSTLEAMRAGLPAVVSDVGGSAEAITEGASGFVVPRGDSRTLTDRLAGLVGDASLRRRMGDAARRRYEAEFTFTRMLDRTLAVYDAVAGRAAVGR